MVDKKQGGREGRWVVVRNKNVVRKVAGLRHIYTSITQLPGVFLKKRCASNT